MDLVVDDLPHAARLGALAGVVAVLAPFLAVAVAAGAALAAGWSSPRPGRAALVAFGTVVVIVAGAQAMPVA